MSDSTPLTVAEPASAPTRGVVVVQEAFGVNEHIEDLCRRFAAESYLAVAPHLFHRSGDPSFGYDEVSLVWPHMEQLTPDGILEDIDSAIARLSEAGVAPEAVGIVGFCMGGSVALFTGTRRSIGAAVTFYGGGVSTGRFGFAPLVDEALTLRVPWLGLFGDLDESIPVEDVEALRAAAAKSGQPIEVVRYPDAEHGFHCDQRSSYHPASSADAWRRTLAWFDQHLAS